MAPFCSAPVVSFYSALDIAGIANEHTDRNTTAYIQNWLEKLEEDNRLIIHAAANAQRAVDLILGSTFEEENETTENAGMPL